jgi:hypothetical protein
LSIFFRPPGIAAKGVKRTLQSTHDRVIAGRQVQSAWVGGSIEDWVLEGHRLAQTVAYRDLGSENPSLITPAYERQADPVIELQLLRLAYLLDAALIEARPQLAAALTQLTGLRWRAFGAHLAYALAFYRRSSPTSRQVAVINQAFARKFFPKQDPIGRHFGMDDARHNGDYEIVGIVEDTKYQNAREPAYPTFFLPFLQLSKDPKQSWMVYSHYVGDIELHVAARPENVEAVVRRTLAGVDPNPTILDMMSMNEQLARNFNQGPAHYPADRAFRPAGAAPGLRRSVWRHRLFGRAAHR